MSPSPSSPAARARATLPRIARAGPAPEAPSLPALFEVRAARRADATAILARSGGVWAEVSWGELARRVRDVAAGLAALGVERGDRVGVLSETRLEAILVDLGTLAAGAIAVPIYQTTTPREVEHALRHSGAVVVFCDAEEQARKVREIRARLPALREVVRFDGAGDGAERPLGALEALGRARAREHPREHEERIAEIAPDDPASILYTSGTTGAPKGVVLTHDAWLHAGAAVGRLAVVQPDDLGLLFLPLAHAFAKLCVVAWIETGGRLALSESAERLVADAAEVRPTFLPAPPRVYEKVFGAVVSKGLAERGLRGRLFRLAMRGFDRWSAARDRGEDRRDLAFLLARRLVLPEVGRALRARLGGRVRFLVSGSAPLSPRISRFFDEAGLPILEGYAMTECASAATVTRPGRVRHGSVGEALPGVEIRIADDGEVLLRGPTLMAGYWHDPEATLEALRDGWLHTGDLGALDEDGFLRITDRKKDVFKTSGGKMVAPQLLEREVKAAEPLVSQVLVHGHGRRFVSALLTLDPAAVRRWAAESGLAITEPLGEDPNVRERIARSIEAVNRELPRFATVKRFAILPGELGAGCGELTPTMKLRRRAVEERYRAVLDSLYEP